MKKLVKLCLGDKDRARPMYLTKFVFSVVKQCDGKTIVAVESHPAFSQKKTRYDRRTNPHETGIAIRYKKNELAGTQYVFKTDMLIPTTI